MERHAKKESYILFPEDVTLPSLPNIDALPNEEKLLIRSKYKLELFWVGSCYHLEQEAFPKLEGRKEKRLKLAELKEEDVEIERFSDRFKQNTHAKHEALESYLKQTTLNFPPVLIQGAKQSQRVMKKLQWDRESSDKKFDMFAKLEENFKGKDGEAEIDESDDEREREAEEEGEEESDDGDYNQNVDFDDDDDDMVEEEPEEDFYE